MRIGLSVALPRIDQKSWSGTIWNIAEAFHRKGIETVYFPYGAPNQIEQKAVSLFVRAASNCWDGIAWTSPIGRKYYRRNLKRRMLSEKHVDAVMHFSDPLGVLLREESIVPQYCIPIQHGSAGIRPNL